MIILSLDLLAIGPLKFNILIRIPMVFDLRNNLGVILQFPLDYSYLHFDLKIFNEEIHENIQFFLILPPDLPPIGNNRLKIVIKIHGITFESQFKLHPNIFS